MRLRNYSPFVAFLLLGLFAGTSFAANQAVDGKTFWYKGNVHAHSFWSDGDTFPEMAVDWYKQAGYDFLAMSEHNRLAEGQRWKDISDKKRPIPKALMQAYRKRFGDDWIDVRENNGKQQVRLKTHEEIRALLEEPGEFLMIQNTEITGKSQGLQVHVNALNVAEAIQPKQGEDVVDSLRLDLRAVEQQSRRLNRPIVAIVNHPNWPTFDLPPSVLAAAEEARLFELCNASPGCHFFGDSEHPRMERVWDIANTIRIAQMQQPPLYGVASDDTHRYLRFAPDQANPGRGFVVVRAEQLKPDAIVRAMQVGDFYASTGVKLRDVSFDREKSLLAVEAIAEPGVNYQVEFVGTLADYDSGTKTVRIEGRRPHDLVKYSPEIGRTLATHDGPKAEYRLTGKELYVRAVVRSDKPMARPARGGVEKETAWCQPVGWEDRVESK